MILRRVSDCLSIQDFRGAQKALGSISSEYELIINLVSKLISSETQYFSMEFLNHDMPLYDLILQEATPNIPQSLLEIVHDIQKLVELRLQLIELYKSVPNIGRAFSLLKSFNKVIDKEELSTLKPIMLSVRNEIEVLSGILTGHMAVGIHDLQSSVLNLFFARNGLMKWKQRALEIQSRYNVKSLLQEKLEEMTQRLHIKIGLCFHKVLGAKDLALRHSTEPKVRFHDEIRSSYLACVLDIYDTLNPLNISLIYLKQPNSKFQQGFEFSQTDSVPLTGIRSYPIVLSYPQDEPPLEYLPSIVSLLLLNFKSHSPPLINFLLNHSRVVPKLEELDTYHLRIGDVFVFYDSVLDVTFTHCRLDENYLFVILSNRKLSKSRTATLPKLLFGIYQYLNPAESIGQL
ncbi:hypothetical protein BC833DRAFT_575480 [Globomyces pollinis-pini]|nr:hypothetical protein BC833DRAFT_575480 [Globomyces pollinis-pini]